MYLHTGCGGVVYLNPCGETNLTYKLNQNYTPNEFCIWPLTSYANNVGPVNITIDRSGFTSGATGLTACSFDSSVTSVEMPTL